MSQKLLPNKNHKIFLEEMCNLINDYDKLNNFRNEDEVSEMLNNRIPKILNNFDKSNDAFLPVATLLYNIFEGIGTVIKLIKMEE